MRVGIGSVVEGKWTTLNRLPLFYFLPSLPRPSLGKVALAVQPIKVGLLLRLKLDASGGRGIGLRRAAAFGGLLVLKAAVDARELHTGGQALGVEGQTGRHGLGVCAVVIVLGKDVGQDGDFVVLEGSRGD